MHTTDTTDARTARESTDSKGSKARQIPSDGGPEPSGSGACRVAPDGGEPIIDDHEDEPPNEDPPVVVKIGGARAVDPAGAIQDVAHLVANGREVVVVHGGSTAVDETLEELGEEATYVETPGGVVGRFTDERTMEVFTMVMPGKLNTDIVATLREAGVDALGLSGVDGGLLTGPRKSAVRVVEDGKKKIKRGDHSGKITDVNASLLSTLLGDGYVPVVTVPMLADDGVPVNADADRAAAAVAGALGAQLVVLTDVSGVYENPDDDSTLIESVRTAAEFEALEDAAEGFMTKKVMAAEEALSGGATEVIVADANNRDPIVDALSGGGTHVYDSVLDETGDEEEVTAE
ncbi:N-acetylglutamate kinase [Halopelagius inordinatus]|uniref:Putative [LysW]-aminoadipate/[LysW]-glutamate kinase n=1 Tax=Halopelagius inordinatus TaxID=553467 RepID=A0A1I2LC12_9EURY|nr:acetylglutamate/acetylaminoadipate kinase [Halopelagius inordinatus]SFF76009.1 N-acetylglutamate kinase [Halopelagius inordinatus]